MALSVTTIANLCAVLASGFGFFLLKDTGYIWTLYGTFALFFVASLLGFLRNGLTSAGNMLNKLHYYAHILSRTLGLPCLATQIYLNNGFKQELSLIHAGCGAFVFLVCLNQWDHTWQDILVLGNALSISYVGVIQKGYFAVAAAGTYVINHFVIRGTALAQDIPGDDYFPFGIAVFEALAIKALWK